MCDGFYREQLQPPVLTSAVAVLHTRAGLPTLPVDCTAIGLQCCQETGKLAVSFGRSRDTPFDLLSENIRLHAIAYVATRQPAKNHMTALVTV